MCRCSLYILVVLFQTHTELLHSLYRQLVTGLQTLPSHDEQLATFNTTELGILITEQLSMLTNASQRAEEKVTLRKMRWKMRTSTTDLVVCLCSAGSLS